MALTAALTAQTAAATSAVITLYGPTEFKADDLSEGESIVIERIRVDGTYETDIAGGAPIVMTKAQPTILVEGYSERKVTKGPTINAVAVGYAS